MVGGLLRCSTRLLQKEQKTQQQRKRKRGHCGDEAKAVGPSMNSAHRWFSGKSFYLCRAGKKSGSKVSYFYKLPGSWIQKSFTDDMVRKAKKKYCEKVLLLESYHHSLRHEDQPPIALPQSCVLRYDPSSMDVRTGPSAWAALGSTIYLFGCCGKGVASHNIFSIQTAGTISIKSSECLKEAGRMVSKRYKAKVVVMDGKIYVFGGAKNHNNDEAVLAEVFEPEPNNPIGHSRALTSPPTNSDVVVAAVALEKERKIIVYIHFEMYEYDVDGDSWGKIVVDNPVSFSLEPRNPYCQPVAVGTVLYWLDRQLMAYDLEKKLLYKGPIEDRLLQYYLESPNTLFTSISNHFKVSLIHLRRNCFCVVWVERDMPRNLHFTVIRVMKLDSIFSNNYNLQVSVLSCQTIFSRSRLKLTNSVLMI